MSPIKFGTDGWRGVVADVYTYENVRIVAQATAEHIKTQVQGTPTAVVGYDCRFASEDFALLSAQQLAAAGYDVLLSDAPCPSPAVSLLTHVRNAGIGVMITASHNPPRYNGFKLKATYGGSATPDLTDPIEKIAQSMPAAPAPDPASYEGRITTADFRGFLMDDLARKFDLETIKKVQGPILVDVMHGSGAGYLTPFLKDLGVDAREFRGDRNPYFGGVNPEPLPQNLQDTVAAVKELKPTAVLIADGDADRIAAMDEDGRFVSPHEIFALFLMHLVEDRGERGTVAQSISSTTMVATLAKKYGLPLVKTAVGFKWIADLFISDPNMLIGGEESGGIGVRGHIPERDAQYCGLMILEMMAHRGKSLKRLVEEDLWGVVGFHAYNRRDLHLPDAVCERIRADVKVVDPKKLAGVPVTEVDRSDGTRFDMEDGSWLLVRPSGTEPMVRVYAESTSTEKVEALLDEGVAMCR
ncbi:MAG TPA: phosphoglucomutase/phosphomannomutase family protein [Armatimonadota bacterium]